MTAKLGHIPELVEEIARYSDPKTRRTLLLMNKSVLATILPLIWQNVRGVEHLLRLIKGADWSTSDAFATLNIKLPKKISKKALTRFKLYAPLVQHLEVFNGRTPNYQLHNFKALLALSMSEPLLPNLRSLTFFNGRAPLSLMLLFISPSLVEYRMIYIILAPPRLLGPRRASAILSTLNRRCPALHTLELYAYYTQYEHLNINRDEEYLIPVHDTVLTDFNTSILRNLSTSLFILGKLDDLRPLSHIERLEIFYNDKNRTLTTILSKFKGVEWSGLRHLSIYSLTNLESLTLLWDATTLVANLTSLIVELDDVFLRQGRVDLIGTFTTLLAERSPRLTDLSLHQCESPMQPRCNPALPISLITNLKLHKLVVHNDVTALGAPTDLSQHLSGRTFGWIKVIDWEPYCVDLEVLQLFAQSMPNLDLLDIAINIPSGGVQETVPGGGHQQMLRLHISHALHDWTAKKRDTDWAGPSRFILSLWPNVDLRIGYYAESRCPGWEDAFKRLQKEKTE
ncbi:hypothetical protein FRC08_002977 [Ceratobasidium sp. 394]|nr:hypothetical protein FRC08_002977 [Ceratobasidium sp. 394]